jgi:hypothetical protein
VGFLWVLGEVFWTLEVFEWVLGYFEVSRTLGIFGICERFSINFLQGMFFGKEGKKKGRKVGPSLI